MRKALYASLVVVLLCAIAMCVHAKSDGTAFFPLMQADSPLAIVETTHSIDDGLKAAILKNVAGQPIVEYRMGWVAVLPQGIRTGLGIRVLLPEGAMPGRSINVPAQRFPMDSFKEGATASDSLSVRFDLRMVIPGRPILTPPSRTSAGSAPFYGRTQNSPKDSPHMLATFA